MQVPVNITGPVGSLALEYIGGNADKVIEFVKNCTGNTPTFKEPDVLEYPVIGGTQLITVGSWLVWDTTKLHCMDEVYFSKNFTIIWEHPQQPVPVDEPEGRAIGSYAINHSTIAEDLDFYHHNEFGTRKVRCIKSNYGAEGHPIYGLLTLVWLDGDVAMSMPVGELGDTDEFSMDYLGAVEAAKQGHRVCRKGWNGADMCLVYVPAADIPTKGTGLTPFFGDTMPMRAHWLLKTATGDVASWSPSTSDSLATDWEIYSPE
ncbi:DUF2829 domain-containing protein [Vibrio phage SSP002]|uniref:Thoeris anti-defense 2-like domain-containing protein n=3 Tax=Mardecavirus SSP002 TaxID=1921699 RepID=A0A384X303_9CAUD|nr:DUF2829 domain-containing protein [Vibrio phage SSP002]AFE86339.1 hypothetical protein SSP002_012 [Vibrio phage SSP002]ATI19417.1 hypothetical protein KF6_009 [Vibrio phage vB_VpaS_KF6]QAY01802.1 hypothetical protein ValLY3_81 [Vibrio phage ValLY_3]UYD21415.1 hypothetical protein [Vibrio phage 27Ua.3]